MKSNALLKDINEGCYTIQLPEKDFEFVGRITGILREMLGINFTIEEMLSRIINCYRIENNYISLFSLSKQVKFSLNEVNRLATFSDREKRALDYMLSAHRRNKRIATLTELVKKELNINNGRLDEIDGESFVINELWNELENDYDSKFRSNQYRKGIKKLIIKSVIVAGVVNTNCYM